MSRSVVAVLIGFVVLVMCFLLMAYILSPPQGFHLWPKDVFWLAVAGAMPGAAGGYMTAVLAKHAPIRHAALLAIVVTIPFFAFMGPSYYLGVLGAAIFPNHAYAEAWLDQPPITFSFLAAVPAVVLGGMIRGIQAHGR